VDDLMWQGEMIAADLLNSGIDIEPTSHMVAMIAYLHKLGGDIETKTESNETGE